MINVSNAKNKTNKPIDKKKKLSCGVTEIIKPCRFINPYMFYRVNSYVIIGEENRQVFFTLEYLYKGKTVTHIELDSPYKDTLTIHLENTFAIPTVPHEYLIERLKSFGNTESYEWAQIIQKYKENYKSAFNTILNFTQSNPYLNDALVKENENIENILKEKPCAWFDMDYSEDDIHLKSVGFTMDLIKALKYTLPSFLKICFEEGIPRLFKTNEDSPKLFGKFVFNTLFFPYFKRVIFKKPTELWDAYKSSLPAFEEKGALYQISSNGTIECRHFAKFDLNTEESHYDSSLFYQENDAYLTMMKKKNKLLFEFLKKFEYVELGSREEKQPKVIDENKICKYRELYPSPIEEIQPQKKIHA